MLFERFDFQDRHFEYYHFKRSDSKLSFNGISSVVYLIFYDAMTAAEEIRTNSHIPRFIKIHYSHKINDNQ